jgi:hypothetical protein
MSDKNLFPPDTKVIDVDGIFNDNSILFARVDGVDYHLLTTGKTFAFWAIFNGLRVTSPLYNGDATALQVWNGGLTVMDPYSEGQVPTYSLSPSVVEEFSRHLNGCPDCKCDG